MSVNFFLLITFSYNWFESEVYCSIEHTRLYSYRSCLVQRRHETSTVTSTLINEEIKRHLKVLLLSPNNALQCHRISCLSSFIIFAIKFLAYIHSFFGFLIKFKIFCFTSFFFHCFKKKWYLEQFKKIYFFTWFTFKISF